jgi:hypothetical protein
MRDDLVSVEAARRDYRVAVSPDGTVDAAATQALREGRGGDVDNRPADTARILLHDATGAAPGS